MVSRCKIGMLVGAFNQDMALVVRSLLCDCKNSIFAEVCLKLLKSDIQSESCSEVVVLVNISISSVNKRHLNTTSERVGHIFFVLPIGHAFISSHSWFCLNTRAANASSVFTVTEKALQDTIQTKVERRFAKISRRRSLFGLLLVESVENN